MEYTYKNQLEAKCFLPLGQPASRQAVWRQQLLLNDAGAAGVWAVEARVMAQLKIQLGTAMCVAVYVSLCVCVEVYVCVWRCM